jgi:hypothetical protein
MLAAIGAEIAVGMTRTTWALDCSGAASATLGVVKNGPCPFATLGHSADGHDGSEAGS